MKSIIRTIAIAAMLVCGMCNAATVTIATGLAGTSVQGIRLSESPDNSVVLSSSEFYVGVGRYDLVAGTFTPWATIVLDSATGSPSSEISGSFATTNPAVAWMDGQKIHVYAGLISSTPSTAQGVAFSPTGCGWVVFETVVASHVFPVVTGTSSVSVTLNGPASDFPSSGVNVVATGDPSNRFAGGSSISGSAGYSYLICVPEPSSALLCLVSGGFMFSRGRKC